MTDSERMVKEAYAAAYALPPPIIRKKPGAWDSTHVALEQMYLSNLITRREYLEQLEGL